MKILQSSPLEAKELKSGSLIGGGVQPPQGRGPAAPLHMGWPGLAAAVGLLVVETSWF